MKEERKLIGFKAFPSLYRYFKMATALNEIQIQDALELLMIQYIKEEAPVIFLKMVEEKGE